MSTDSGCGTIVLILHCIPLIIALIMKVTGNLPDTKNERQKKSSQEYEAPIQNYPSYHSAPSNVYRPPTYYHSPRIQNRHSNSDYDDLLEECKELSSKLSDHDIDHEEPDESMDYDDLDILRDELQSMVDDNEID